MCSEKFIQSTKAIAHFETALVNESNLKKKRNLQRKKVSVSFGKILNSVKYIV